MINALSTTGYDTRDRVRKASALRTALQTAGLPVPTELDDALNSLAWTIETPADPDTSALFTAKTEAEYRKAADVYADALAAQDRVTSVQDVAQTARLDVVSAVFPAARQEAVSAAVELFDQAAEKFTDAVQAFPDVDITSLTPDQFSHYADAREHADTMRRAYTVYTAVHGADPTQGTAADTAWFRIADLEDRDALVAVYEANQRHRTGALAPLAPYVAVVRNGAALRLVSPDAATTAHEMATARQAVKNEENRPATVSVPPNQAGVSSGTFAKVAANLRPMGRLSTR